METENTLSQISKEDRALIKASEKFVESFGLAKIENQETYDLSAKILTDIKKRIYEIEYKRVEITKPINEGLRGINEFFKKPIERLQGLEGTIKNLMGVFIRQKELEAAEAQRKADEAARKEREKAEAAAAKAREKADQEFAKGNESAAAAALAKADIKEAEAAVAVAPVIVAAVNKSGLSLIGTWSAKIIDKERFIKWAVENKALEYILIDEKLLNKEAKATKGLRTWPGINIVKSQIEKMRI